MHKFRGSTARRSLVRHRRRFHSAMTRRAFEPDSQPREMFAAGTSTIPHSASASKDEPFTPTAITTSDGFNEVLGMTSSEAAGSLPSFEVELEEPSSITQPSIPTTSGYSDALPAMPLLPAWLDTEPLPLSPLNLPDTPEFLSSNYMQLGDSLPPILEPEEDYWMQWIKTESPSGYSTDAEYPAATQVQSDPLEVIAVHGSSSEGEE